MQITKEELLDALDNLYNPYPAFGGVETDAYKEFFSNLETKIREETGILSSYKTEEIAESIQDEIRDDIQNCGRNPLSKFMESAKTLAYLQHFDKEAFDWLIDYLYEAINDHG